MTAGIRPPGRPPRLAPVRPLVVSRSRIPDREFDGTPGADARGRGQSEDGQDHAAGRVRALDDRARVDRGARLLRLPPAPRRGPVVKKRRGRPPTRPWTPGAGGQPRPEPASRPSPGGTERRVPAMGPSPDGGPHRRRLPSPTAQPCPPPAGPSARSRDRQVVADRENRPHRAERRESRNLLDARHGAPPPQQQWWRREAGILQIGDCSQLR